MSTRWQNVDGGPRQVKDLNRALSALRSEGQAQDEVYGVIGGEERRSTVVAMMGTVRPEVTALEEAIGERCGWKVTRATVRAIIADYQAALTEARKSRPVVDNRRTPEEEAERLAAAAKRDAEREAAQAAQNALMDQVMAKAPAGAKALIFAEWHEDNSDPMTDYFNSRTTRTVAIGFRSSSREDFRALRRAAGQFPETAHLETDPGAEHRENYSMGSGNYLSDHGSDRSGTGWVIRSRDIPCSFVHVTEDAVPEVLAESAASIAAPRTASTPQRSTQVDDDVIGILARATADGNAVRMAERLDRATYIRVDEALRSLGGKWNRRAQAHLFPSDAAPVLAALQADGSIVRPQDEGYFPTPAAIVADMIAIADLEPEMAVLEPSAGDGAIVRTVADLGCAVDCIELNPKRAAALCTAGYARTVTMADFLTSPQRPVYDRVLMNPPFADKADIAHVTHALGFLRPGGLLIAVMSNGVMSREDRATAGFRDMVNAAGGLFEPLPDGAFKESGTGVRTVLVVLPATAERSAAA